MDEGICGACGSKYIIIAGHACGDTSNTVIVRATLAKEMMKRQALQAELDELRKYVTPIAKHFSHEYNKWRIKNAKCPSYTEAGTYIIKYFRSLAKDEE